MAAKTKPKVPKRTAALDLLEFARDRAQTAQTWMELHNAVYGIGGKFGELFPDQSSRAAFTKSEEFQALSTLIGSLPGEFRFREKGEASSGKFLVRLPASLHAALAAEAEAEGVSLNQLCVAKLAAQLRAIV